MFEFRLEPWSERPQARWALLGGLCVVLASLLLFALPTVSEVRFGVEAHPTSLLFECFHALQNGLLAVACVWVFQRVEGCGGLGRPLLMILALLLVGVGGDLLLHWGQAVAYRVVLEEGHRAVFSAALGRVLPAVAPYTPVLLWLLAGGLAVWAGRRQKSAGGTDAYALVVATQALTLAGGMLAVFILLQFLMIAVARKAYLLMIANMSHGYFMAPLCLALLVGLVVVPRWPVKLRHAGAFDLFALGVLMALLPGALCVMLLQVAQAMDERAVFGVLPAVMLLIYLLCVPWMARWARRLALRRVEEAA